MNQSDASIWFLQLNIYESDISIGEQTVIKWENFLCKKEMNGAGIKLRIEIWVKFRWIRRIF